MTDGDLSCEADHDVEAECGDAEDADLDQEAQRVFVQHIGREADQYDATIIMLRLVVVGNTVVSAA